MQTIGRKIRIVTDFALVQYMGLFIELIPLVQVVSYMCSVLSQGAVLIFQCDFIRK